MIAARDTDLARRIAGARASRRRLHASDRPVALDAGYAIQEQLAAGRRLNGFKLGMVSAAKQQQMGIDAPLYGRVFADMLHDAPLSLDRFMQPRLEPEVVAVVGESVPAGADPERAIAAVASFRLGVDVLDTVWDGYRFSPGEVVADNVAGGGFLLGPPLDDLPPTGALRLSIDGHVVAEGEIEDLGDPGRRLSWLAAHTGGLRRGHYVFMGSPAASEPARPGELRLDGPGGEPLVAQLTSDPAQRH